MSHHVETMAYAGETPWHGLGHKVSGCLTPQEMLVAAELDWKVAKKPMYLKGNPTPIKGRKALVRDSDGEVLSICTDSYQPIQNEDALSFFNEFAKAGDVTMETAGSLKGGRYIWALAKMKKGINLNRHQRRKMGRVKSSDDVEGYVLLLQPHEWGFACSLRCTPVRVVCWNTLTLAINTTTRDDKIFKIRHSGAGFTPEMQEQAAIAVGLAAERFDAFGEAASFLSGKRASEADVLAYFDALADFKREDKEIVRLAEKRAKLIEPRILGHLKMALEEAPGAQTDAAKGTWWGAFNAVTFTVDHTLGRGRDTALASAWIGQGATMKIKALDLAMQAAR